MPETATKPYDWLRAITPDIIGLQDFSTTGGPQNFSWENLSRVLAKRFEIQDLKVQPTRLQWRSENEAASGLGHKLFALHYGVSSLAGKASFLLSQNDLSILMAALLTKSADTPLHVDKGFQEGFLHFLAVELTNVLAQVGFDADLLLETLEEEDGLPGSGLCQDIAITLHGKTIPARLIASEELARGWKERFADKARRTRNMEREFLRDLDVTVHFEAGKVALPLRDFEQAKPGDFIVLDSCSVFPQEQRGRIVMTVEGIPIFRGMLKQDKIKILEYPLYHKIETAMEHDDDLDREEQFDEQDEESGFDEEEEELDEDEEEELDEDEEEELDEDEEEELAQQEETPALGKAPPIVERAQEIPITITVEVGRIKMKLDKLTQLQPGELLELEVAPEEGVDLVFNGRCVGRGELLKLGETLGVRILELA